MEYKVTVVVDNEQWQLSNQRGRVDVHSKKDKDYLHRTYLALLHAMSQIIAQGGEANNIPMTMR